MCCLLTFRKITEVNNIRHKKTQLRLGFFMDRLLLGQIALSGGHYFSASSFGISPALYFYPLSWLKCFVVLKVMSDLSNQQFRQVRSFLHMIIEFGQFVWGTAKSLASIPDSSLIFKTPTTRLRITAPGQLGRESLPVRPMDHRLLKVSGEHSRS